MEQWDFCVFPTKKLNERVFLQKKTISPCLLIFVRIKQIIMS